MHFESHQLDMPKHLLALTEKNLPQTEHLPRRTFLKMAGASGFALGCYPLLASAADNKTDAAAQAASALKPTQQPGAFVSIDKMASSPSPLTVSILVRACRPACL